MLKKRRLKVEFISFPINCLTESRIFKDMCCRYKKRFVQEFDEAFKFILYISPDKNIKQVCLFDNCLCLTPLCHGLICRIFVEINIFCSRT